MSLAEVAGERDPAHVLDDLAERREAVVRVLERRAGVDGHAETAAVIVGQRRHALAHGHAQLRRTLPERAPVRVEEVGDADHLGDAGGVGQQMTHGRRPEARPRRDQLVGAQVVARGGIEVDQSSLPELHDRDRGEQLGDGGDPEDRVLGDRRVRGDVGEPVAVEEDRRPSRTTPSARPTAGRRWRISRTRPSRSTFVSSGRGTRAAIAGTGTGSCRAPIAIVMRPPPPKRRRSTREARAQPSCGRYPR